MVMSAKEAFVKTVGVLEDKLDKELLEIFSQKIDEAVQEGHSSVMVKKEDLGLDGVPRVMRQFETYFRCKGYQVEVGYGCGNIDIRWA